MSAFAATVGDVIVCDRNGHAFLLTTDADVPTPLSQTEVNQLGMFFEPAVDLSWHSEPELRQMFCRDVKVATSA